MVSGQGPPGRTGGPATCERGAAQCQALEPGEPGTVANRCSKVQGFHPSHILLLIQNSSSLHTEIHAIELQKHRLTLIRS